MKKIKQRDKKIGKTPKSYKLKPKRHKVTRLVTLTIIIIAIATALTGMMIVDHNSRFMGWNDNITELAFAAYSDRLDITVLGQKYFVDTTIITGASGVYTQLKKGLDYLKPSPLRLVDMLYLYIKEETGS